MYKILSILSLLILLSFSSFAQDYDEDLDYEEEEGPNGDFMVTGILRYNYPLGDFGDFFKGGYGLNLGIEYKVSNKIGLGLQTGYNISNYSNVVAGRTKNYSMIPVLLNLYYYFPKATGFWPYAGIDFGFSLDKYKDNENFPEINFSDNNITYAPVFGFLTPMGDELLINANLRYIVISNPKYLNEKANISFISLNVGAGYKF